LGPRRIEHILTIKPIKYTQILDSPNAQTLLAEYSAECSIPEIGAPNPQRELYARMEASDLMHSFGVFAENEMIGFATVLIFPLPHYGKQIANVESLFVAKAHRGGGSGRGLMQFIETFATAMNCAGVLYNARMGSNLERLLGSLPRYKRTNSVFLWSAN
jgi:GNAT superfamily N-acetyltransferase